MDIMGADFSTASNDEGPPESKRGADPASGRKIILGIVDLVKMKAYYHRDDLGKQIDETDIPEDMKELAEEYHAKLVEAVASRMKVDREVPGGRRTNH